MQKNTENKNLIQKFLFGELPEDERFKFEERFITNADHFEEIKAYEDDLIEKYVRGWMDPAEKLKFEQNFLTTKKRRERVEFSRQLIREINLLKNEDSIQINANEENITSSISVWNKFAAFLTPKYAVSGAFVLFVLIIGGWFLNQNFGNKSVLVINESNDNLDTPSTNEILKPNFTPKDLSENNQNESDSENNRNQAQIDDNSQKTPSNSNENRNGSSNKTIEEIKKTPAPDKTPVQKTAPNPVLALFAGTVRSEGKNNVLNLPKEAKAATLLLNLESVDYKVFSAQITDADGNVIFQKSNLKASKSKLNLIVPAKNIKRGDYIIKLFGKNDGFEIESVADFQFRVN